MAEIIEIGKLRLARKGARYGVAAGDCEHKHLTLDANGHIVVCTDCKQQVSTWWALNLLVDQYEKAYRGLQARSQTVQLQIRDNLHLIAAKRVEKVWRSRMIPTCPHCNRGIRPDDGFGSTAIHPKLDEKHRSMGASFVLKADSKVE